MTNTPRYKLVAPDDREYVTFHNMPERAGKVVDHLGWPDPLHMKLVNEPARRIAEFAKAHEFHSAKPPSPVDALCGQIYLPVMGSGYREGKSVTPDMPRYIARDHNIETQNRVLPAGQEFVWLAWPTEGMDPANESAEAIAEYFQVNRDNPRLPISPWNAFDDSLWLPDLPEVRKGVGTAEQLQPHYRTAHPEEMNRGRLMNVPAAS